MINWLFWPLRSAKVVQLFACQHFPQSGNQAGTKKPGLLPEEQQGRRQPSYGRVQRRERDSAGGVAVVLLPITRYSAGASHDATYLLADVEVIATYQLHNLNRTKLEGIFHRLFGPAQIDITIDDRFGNPVKPREWFLVPINVIDEAVRRIQDGSIVKCAYDPQLARLVEQAG